MLLSVTDPLFFTGFRPEKFRTLFAEVASQHSQEFVCALSRQITEHIATNVDLIYRILEKCRRVKQVSTGAEGDNNPGYEEIKSLVFQKLRLNLLASEKICCKEEEEIPLERFRVFVRNFLNITEYDESHQLLHFNKTDGEQNKSCFSPTATVEIELSLTTNPVKVSFDENQVKKTVTIANKKEFVFNLAHVVMRKLFVTSGKVLTFNKKEFDNLFELTQYGCQLKKRAFLKLWDNVTLKEEFRGKLITSLRWGFILSNILFSTISTPYLLKTNVLNNFFGVDDFITAHFIIDVFMCCLGYKQYNFSPDVLVPSHKKIAQGVFIFLTIVKIFVVFVSADFFLTHFFSFTVIDFLRSFSRQVLMMDGDLSSGNVLWALGASVFETLTSVLFYNQLYFYEKSNGSKLLGATQITIATKNGDFRTLDAQVQKSKNNTALSEILKNVGKQFQALIKIPASIINLNNIPGYFVIVEFQKKKSKYPSATEDSFNLGLTTIFKNHPNILKNIITNLDLIIDYKKKTLGVQYYASSVPEVNIRRNLVKLQTSLNENTTNFLTTEITDFLWSNAEDWQLGLQWFGNIWERLSISFQRGISTRARPLEPKSKPPIPKRFYYSVFLFGLHFLQRGGNINSLRDLIRGYSRLNFNFQPLFFTEVHEKQNDAFESVSSHDFFTKSLVLTGYVFSNVRYGDTLDPLTLYSSLSKIKEGSHTGVILKSLTMQGGYEFDLDKTAGSAKFLSNITSESSIQEVLYEQNNTDVFLNRKDQIRKILTLQNVSGTLFKVTRGKLLLRTQRGVDLHYGQKLRANALTVDIHGGGAHVSTVAKYHMEEKNILSINDLYQTDLGSIWFEHRFTQTGLKAKDFHLKLVYPQRGEAPAGVALRMDQAFFQDVVFDFLSPMDLVHIQYGMGPRMVPASTLFFKVLSQKRDASDLNYHMKKKYLTEIIPEAGFLKTDLLDFTGNPHDTPEYKGVEFLLSRPYCGNMKLVIGDKCYDLTCEIIRFLAAFLLYRKSSTFEEPKDAALFWDGAMDELLENVFEAMKGEVGLDYDSYNSSSGVPVFGNGKVKIMPDELLREGFCPNTSSVQTSTKAHVVSLLRGICARYAPGARQAAAY